MKRAAYHALFLPCYLHLIALALDGNVEIISTAYLQAALNSLQSFATGATVDTMALPQELTMDQIDDSVVPGTVHLVDLEYTLRTKHAKGSYQDVVLVPTPSNDPDDPLNWTPRRKALSATCWIVYVLEAHAHFEPELMSLKIYLGQRHRQQCGVFRASSFVGVSGYQRWRSQRRNGLSVPPRRLWAPFLAAICAAIRKASSVSPVDTWNPGHDNMVAIQQRKWPMDREEHRRRLYGCPY